MTEELVLYVGSGKDARRFVINELISEEDLQLTIVGALQGGKGVSLEAKTHLPGRLYDEGTPGTLILNASKVDAFFIHKTEPQ